jgi:hypothetical protein
MENELLAHIKAKLPELERLLQEMDSHWGYEDPIYRFYHHSFKVYMLQDETRRIVDALKDLAQRGKSFCREFEEIIAKYFLEMVVKYGRELEEPPHVLPSGWAAILCLYELR